MAEDRTATLRPLSETMQTVANHEEDVRGRTVVDRDGEEIGTVDDLLVDDSENRVRFLRVGSGGFLGIGKEHILVPVDAVTTVDAEVVRIGRARGRLSDVPVYDPALAEEPNYYAGVYGYWGYAPYWSGGYISPTFPY